MTTIIATHEVKDGEKWAKAWQAGPGSRGEIMAQAGVAEFHTLRDPQHPNQTGILFEVSDLAKFNAFMQSPESAKAMGEDGVKPETLKVLQVFVP